MDKRFLHTSMALVGFSLAIACLTYIFNVWLFSVYPRLPPASAHFLEGIIFIMLGVLFLLGSGGLSYGSLGAATLAAKALGRDVIGPSEVLRRDAWKPKGLVRVGLILIIAGIFLLVTYFMSFYVHLSNSDKPIFTTKALSLVMPHFFLG